MAPLTATTGARAKVPTPNGKSNIGSDVDVPSILPAALPAQSAAYPICPLALSTLNCAGLASGARATVPN